MGKNQGWWTGGGGVWGGPCRVERNSKSKGARSTAANSRKHVPEAWSDTDNNANNNNIDLSNAKCLF